jgi:hypothetical protein
LNGWCSVLTIQTTSKIKYVFIWQTHCRLESNQHSEAYNGPFLPN